MYQPPTPPSQPPRRACIITLCEAARNQGNRARLYANPRRRGEAHAHRGDGRVFVAFARRRVQRCLITETAPRPTLAAHAVRDARRPPRGYLEFRRPAVANSPTSAEVSHRKEAR